MEHKRNDQLMNAVMSKIHRAYIDSNLAEVVALLDNIPDEILVSFVTKKT